MDSKKRHNKTLGNLAKHLKQLVPADIPKNFSIQSIFTDIANEEDLRRGVFAFRNFLYRFYDCFQNDEKWSLISKKGKEKYSDETTLTVEFPFLNNAKSILMNIGQHGQFSENKDSLIVKDWDLFSLKRSLNKRSRTKIPIPQILKSIDFLSRCGIEFRGIHSKMSKDEIPKIEAIEVTYPENLDMLIGWKVLGIAQDMFSTRKNDDILLRCDYRSLAKKNYDANSIIQDFIKPLSNSERKIILDLHQHNLLLGMKCEVELGFICTHLIYSYKKKALTRFTSSFHNGFKIVYKTKNTNKYPEVIEKFSPYLQEKIAKGYGCDRKSGTSHGNCQKGCEGFKFPINEDLKRIEGDLKTWIEYEVLSMKKKK